MEQLKRKFSYWSEKLLDLTKRNSLLHYKKKKVGSLQFDDELDRMFREILDMKYAISHFPKSASLEIAEEEKEVALNEHKSRLKSLKLI
ncbi:TPA: hypothetical protein ACGOYY_001820, partial [Streptococcus suis]